MSDEQPGNPTSDGDGKIAAPKDVAFDPAPAKDVQTAMQKLAQNRPEKMFEMMAVAGMGVGNPLHQKMEAQHITQVLDLAAKHDEREFELHQTKEANSVSDRSQERCYVFWAFAIVVTLILFVLVLFREQPAVLIPALTGIGGLVGGFAGGLDSGKADQSNPIILRPVPC